MNGKEQIIESILSDAERIAQSMRKEAEEKAAAVLAEAESTVQALKETAARNMEEAEKEQLKRRASIAELDIKKYKLSLKQQMLSGSFDDALKRLGALSKTDYLKFITGLLKQAESGEVVTVAKKDKDIITQEFLKKAAEGKGLKLDSVYGDFSGGVILSKENYEKNFTLEVLLQELRQDIEPEISAILFKD